MSRKRISEEDLLNFRKQAEALSREVEAKYERMDLEAKPEPVPEPTGKMGILLIHDADKSPDQLEDFEKRLRGEGYITFLTDLTGYVPVDRFDRKPLWQRWLEQAQTGYQLLSERCEKVMIMGTGLSCPLACVVAEQYPADALALVGGGLKPSRITLFSGGAKGASFQLARLAKNNLFSIVCPIMCIVPENCGEYTADSADMYAIASRSDDVRTEKIAGVDVSGIWTDCENRLVEAVRDFFTED